jgi:peroxiredoxin
MVEMESDRTLAVGDSAPDFELPGTDGETYSLSDFADDAAVLLVFTCNHCPYAQAKHDTLNDIAADYDDVRVVGVNPNDAAEYPDDSFERMVELVEDGTIQYDHYLRDESQDVARAYGATCTPDPFLLENDDGTFRLAWHGRLDDALNPDDSPSGEPGADMREAIDDVLAGNPVEKDFLASRGCSIKWRD